MVSDLDLSWMARAHGMLRDEQHVEVRNSKNKHADAPGVGLEKSGLAWPGYLGSDYRPGDGVLVIANIHRQFRSGGLADDPGKIVTKMVDATEALQGTDEPGPLGAEYLAATRAVYERGLGPRGWTVGAHINAVYDAAHLGGEDPANRRRIAFVNTSCGQYPEGTKNADIIADGEKIKPKLVNFCSKENPRGHGHPIADVVRLLHPAFVLCMAGFAYAALERVGLTNEVPTIYFHQRRSRGLKLLRPVTLAGTRGEKGAGPDEWLPLLDRGITDVTGLR
jgi:hypothetical protein